jgi:hypothetical protein
LKNGSSADKQTPWFISLRFEARRALEGADKKISDEREVLNAQYSSNSKRQEKKIFD